MGLQLRHMRLQPHSHGVAGRRLVVDHELLVSSGALQLPPLCLVSGDMLAARDAIDHAREQRHTLGRVVGAAKPLTQPEA